MKRGLRANLVGALALTALLTGIAVVPDSPVADAAMRGDRETVRSLLKQGADVSAAQSDGMTALHWAAESGDVEMTEMLIAAGANLEAVTRLGAYAPLHLAAKVGRAETVRALLKAGSSAHATTSTGAVTPLHFAAGAGSADAVAALLDHGADVNARESSWGQTPLMFAAAYNRTDVMKVLLERGADLALTTDVIDLPRFAAVEEAAARRRNEVLQAARTQLPADGQRIWRPSPNQIEAAVRAAHAVQAAGLTAGEPAADGFPAQVGTWGGLTALLHAARQGHVEAVLLLLEAGADIDQASAGDGTTPLLMATINGRFDLSMLLLERGADPNLPGQAGASPLYGTINLHWAPRTRYPQPRWQDQQKTTYLELMTALLKAGADPNARLTDHLWYTSFTYDLLDVDFKGASPLWRAAYATDVEAMKLLVAYGADANVATIKPPARQRGYGSGGSPQADPSGLPPVPDGGPGVWPIHAASGVGYGEGYAANAHRHVPDGWVPAVKYLVEDQGADVNARDHNGYSPLHHAAARGDNELILYLVSKGADVTAISRRGQTTADMANGPTQRIQPFPETIALLERLGSKNNHRCMSC